MYSEWARVSDQESEFFTDQRLGDLNSRLLTDVETASRAMTENIAHTLRGLNSSIGRSFNYTSQFEYCRWRHKDIHAIMPLT